jgi:hypothetical protein
MLILALDLALRFLPTELFTFRAWETLRRYPAWGGQFEANRTYRNDRSYGDLANLGNLPELREYRDYTFTTDAYGHRNPTELLDGRPIDGMLAGDSFIVGESLDDAQTLRAQLAAQTGRRIYGVGIEYTTASVNRLVSLAEKLHLGSGTVVVEYYELFDALGSEGLEPCRLVEGASALGQACTALWGFSQVSPLQILAQRSLRSVQNGRVLPNPYAERVVRGRLRNGEEMLFLPREVQRFAAKPDERPAATNVERFVTALRRHGLDVHVLLVPMKYSVYRPLIQDVDLSETRPPLLDRLEQRLLEAGIPVINLLGPFQTGAAEALDRRATIYWRDDTHWNARGIEIAAKAIRGAWAPLLEEAPRRP